MSGARRAGTGLRNFVIALNDHPPSAFGHPRHSRGGGNPRPGLHHNLSPKDRTGPHDINPLTAPRPAGTINQAQAGD